MRVYSIGMCTIQYLCKPYLGIYVCIMYIGIPNSYTYHFNWTN